MKEIIHIWGQPATPELWAEWLEHIGAGPKAFKAKMDAWKESHVLAAKLKEQQEKRDGTPVL